MKPVLVSESEVKIPASHHLMQALLAAAGFCH
jgi:hypothetical protein